MHPETKKKSDIQFHKNVCIEGDNCILVLLASTIPNSWIRYLFIDALVVFNAILVTQIFYKCNIDQLEKAQASAESYRGSSCCCLQRKGLKELLKILFSFNWATAVKVPYRFRWHLPDSHYSKYFNNCLSVSSIVHLNNRLWLWDAI